MKLISKNLLLKKIDTRETETGLVVPANYPNHVEAEVIDFDRTLDQFKVGDKVYVHPGLHHDVEKDGQKLMIASIAAVILID